MGARNYLIEGVSCSGKTTVCDELLRRGFQAIHGDRQLAYQGDPKPAFLCPDGAMNTTSGILRKCISWFATKASR